MQQIQFTIGNILRVTLAMERGQYSGYNMTVETALIETGIPLSFISRHYANRDDAEKAYQHVLKENQGREGFAMS